MNPHTFHSLFECSIRYHIPGKGGWKEKTFDSKEAAEKFVDKLPPDAEVRWESQKSED